MSETTTAPSFKNEATRRFYQFFRQKIDEKEISVKDLAEAFEVFKKNPSQLLLNMKNGKVSVTIEQVYTAHEKFRLNPTSLFTTESYDDASATTMLAEEGVHYGKKESITIGSILHEIFRKHKTNIRNYAINTLEISEQQLYNILSGKSRVYFDVVLKVCEDHAESLDQFRSRSLPLGHILERIRYLEQILEQKESEIAALKSQIP